jgi:hypothetical protein
MNVADEATVRVFALGVTSSELRLSAIDRPFGEMPSGGNQEGWKKSLREVSAYSTVCPEFA